MSIDVSFNPKNFITDPEVIKDQFAKQAQMKFDEAGSWLKETSQFKAALLRSKNIQEFLKQQENLKELAKSFGFSEKAQDKFSDDDLREHLLNMSKEITDRENPNWRDELYPRYLLTLGDSFGGMIRNKIGLKALSDFQNELLKEFDKKNIKPDALEKNSKGDKIQGIGWQETCLIFDKTPPFFSKNIDVMKLRVPLKTGLKRDYEANNVVACGEIKGGIDPAGADERWKTTCEHLDRIRRGELREAKLFFAGAVITKNMAHEIVAKLNNGELTHAANLTKPEQVASLAEWLIDC